ncbi:hypothetical protein KFK09_000754 [Dendrobium nobile]|uniref:Saposin B type region 2 domain-containing protein n=1 Tax=Dendrobium nobile TaxID=94219 RepID=A0A8T3C9T8_DENNO|nr:hypothetical protein KFK09_000754 [Dendrobium nobile]
MNKLVYVMFNKKLKDRHLKLQNQGNIENEIDLLLVDELQSDDEWVTPKNADVFEVEAEGETHVNEEDNEATTQCKRLVLEYGPVIIFNAEKFFEKTDVCTAIHACKAHQIAAIEQQFLPVAAAAAV